MYTYKKPLTALFLIYILTNPLKAANIIDQGDDDQKEGCYSTQPNNQVEQPKNVYGYTILNNKKVNHTLDDKEEMNKAIKEKDEKINMLKQEINKKNNQLKDKSQELNDLKAQLRKCLEKNTDYQNITEKLKTLRGKFNMQIDNIDIQNEKSVKHFVSKVQEEHTQFDKDMQILRKWYAKYTNNASKHFNDKNREDACWDKIYDNILKKITKTGQNNEKGTLFSSILQSLKTVLSTNQANLWGVTEALDQNNLKNEKHRLEMGKINNELQPANSDSILFTPSELARINDELQNAKNYLYTKISGIWSNK